MSNIKLALSGQYEREFEFTYPEDYTTSLIEEIGWTRSIPDLRAARYFNSERIYAIWRNEYGNYYSVIVPIKDDFRDGKAVLTLMVGKRVPADGSVMLSSLKGLEDMIINSGIRDKEKVGTFLETSIEKNLIPEIVPDKKGEKKSLPKVYRTFSSESELSEIFQNIIQDEFSTYQRVLIVPKGSVKEDAQSYGFEEIKSVIRHYYRVSLDDPNHTKVSSNYVFEGDSLQITYSKNGYDDYVTEVKVQNTGGVFYTIKNKEIVIVGPNVLSLPFKRSVYFKVVSSVTGISVPNFSINNKCFFDGGICRYELEDASRKFRITAEGYEEKIEEVDERDIVTHKTIEVKLKPKQEKLRRIIRIDQTSKEVELSLSPDHPLYPCFKNKHDYEIIVRKKNNSTREEDESGPQPRGDGEKKEWVKNALMILVAAFIIGAMCYAGYEMFSSDEPDKHLVDRSRVQDDTKKTDTSTPADNSQVEEVKEKLDSAEIAYLKRTDVWDISELESKEAKSLITYAQGGNIQELIDHPYSRWDVKNGYWRSAVSLMTTINMSYDSGKINYMKTLIMNLSKNGSLNLIKLVTELQSVANSAPRNTEGAHVSDNNQTYTIENNQRPTSGGGE